MATHLAIFVGTAIDDILEGRKTIECRLSQKQIPPYAIVSRGDVISLKQAGGLVLGEVQVENVLFFTTDEFGLEQLKQKYGRFIKATRSFWKDHRLARYATLIFLKKPRRYLTPLAHKKKDRRPWLVIGP
jgi:predicted transcriptional regulator